MWHTWKGATGLTGQPWRLRLQTESNQSPFPFFFSVSKKWFLAKLVRQNQKISFELVIMLHKNLQLVHPPCTAKPAIMTVLHSASGPGLLGLGGGGRGRVEALSHYSYTVGIWSSCQARDTNCSDWFTMTLFHYLTLHFSFLLSGTSSLSWPSHFRRERRES